MINFIPLGLGIGGSLGPQRESTITLKESFKQATGMKNMSLNLINTQYILIESKESKVTATFKQFGTLGLHFEIERMTVWFNSSRVFRFFWSKES